MSKTEPERRDDEKGDTETSEKKRGPYTQTGGCRGFRYRFNMEGA